VTDAPVAPEKAEPHQNLIRLLKMNQRPLGAKRSGPIVPLA
jgi:hypothetical protein